MISEYLEYIIPALSFILSLSAVLYARKKQTREIENIGSETISNLYDAIAKQEKMYKEQMAEKNRQFEELKLQFEDYKKSLDLQLIELQRENLRLRDWAKRLCKQLQANCIEPEHS